VTKPRGGIDARTVRSKTPEENILNACSAKPTINGYRLSAIGYRRSVIG
jgi:hypothetical protein